METENSIKPSSEEQIKERTEVHESPVRTHKKREKRHPESAKAKRKKLLKEKKNALARLQEAQKVLEVERPPDEEEKELAAYLFGADTFSDTDEEDDKEKEVKAVEKDEESSRKPAWVDRDEETLLVKDAMKSMKHCPKSISVRKGEKYSDIMAEKFTKLMGDPEWADIKKIKSEKDCSSEDELLKQTGHFVESSKTLPKGHIRFFKCPSLTDPNVKQTLIKSVEFHPTSRVAVVASTGCCVNLFQIDGKVNAKIQSVSFENFPVHSAHFSVDGCELFLGSNKYSHLHSYDMMKGKVSRIPWQNGMDQQNMRRFKVSPDGKFLLIHGRYGYLHLMTVKTKEWVKELKMNGEVIATAFNRDGTKMFSLGDTGEVYVWDMVTRSCIHKFIDQGCVTGTALAVSPNEQFLATGSDCGVVNVYDLSDALRSTSPSPMRAIMNLTTEVTSLNFNHSSEVLISASSHKADAVKLIHFPSMNVFSNFPNYQHPIRHPNSLDISPNSGFFCIGNNVGNTQLYRLKHFENY